MLKWLIPVYFKRFFFFRFFSFFFFRESVCRIRMVQTSVDISDILFLKFCCFISSNDVVYDFEYA